MAVMRVTGPSGATKRKWVDVLSSEPYPDSSPVKNKQGREEEEYRDAEIKCFIREMNESTLRLWLGFLNPTPALEKPMREQTVEYSTPTPSASSADRDEVRERFRSFMKQEVERPETPAARRRVRERAVLILLDHRERERLDDQTFQLALAYMDACMASSELRDDELEAATEVCLFLAIKYRKESGSGFRPKAELNTMEPRICSLLGHEFLIPTVAMLLEMMLVYLGVETESLVAGFARRFSNTIASDHSLVPSLGAAVAMFRAVSLWVAEGSEQDKLFFWLYELTGYSMVEMRFMAERVFPGPRNLGSVWSLTLPLADEKSTIPRCSSPVVPDLNTIPELVL